MFAPEDEKRASFMFSLYNKIRKRRKEVVVIQNNAED
jgi:hypothetical protein